MTTTDAQRTQMETGQGFVAALDQSGGSTPKALSLYGVEPSDYSGDAEMFQAMHDMRARIILADDFTSDKVLGAILFERTMDNTINGKPVAQLLWEDRGVVPFLKIDKGLEDEANGVQLLKPMPELDDLLKRAKAAGIFGTKERSVIQSANAEGIASVVAQQFAVAKTVCAAGLVPIIEPEVNIHSESKAEAEDILKSELEKHLAALSAEELVMLKVTLPERAGLYDSLADHPNVLRVVALSGGYSTEDACARLTQNPKMIASFSRALTEGLNVKMSDAEFNTALGQNISKIYDASVA
ncbi:MAG: fructose bisphosphate aldolase [Roseobacter sp.]|jgi:fructose-bisphosphate aldolase class I|uniref:fructose bisphosphate aldolase n=1 Tax=Sulfitobacter TaxID=60136 RepID=UPI0000669F30|nr:MULTISPECIES: fructose bisphosphate aldolase [Sulfitobacter]MBG63001.1 fructose bisphosphate aldolase [Roseobacter sp.]MCP3880020.1 fructose bisphosphate aldolase [Sulfitobacter sp.]AXI51283.1 fructose bisphosphate aldolase [Sulfitobacter sp. SK025]EAP80814.1 fructose-bisphosphate aldolase [Sulfitobacter sp. NAS-14.1]KAJ31470.1 fructose-bisphosphate aldolase [Sulfitobacter pontiacus 3SOLIMAR09]|tara:strand:+ start:130 stop:1023 length:894 start_codon:yes stop_codon:yes gene_type:complete